MQTKVSPIVMLLKFQYVEQLRNGYEEIPYFALLSGKEVPDTVIQKANQRMFPNGMTKAIEPGYDYLVLNAVVDGNEEMLMPGTIIFIRENGNVGIIKTSDGVPTVELEAGKLVLS